MCPVFLMSAIDSPSLSPEKKGSKFNEALLLNWILDYERYGLDYNRLSDQLICVFSVDILITHHCRRPHSLRFVAFSQHVLDRIYQRPRINPIVPRD